MPLPVKISHHREHARHPRGRLAAGLVAALPHVPPIQPGTAVVGKSVASNAPRCMLVLWTQKAIDRDGGDPSKLAVVPLPFNQIAGKVSSGEIDAGVLIQPFIVQGLGQYSSLKN